MADALGKTISGSAMQGDISNAEAVLMLRGITKTFGGVVALSDTDFDVRKGEVHAICGENGAGKSTLCNIVTGIYQPTEGEMYWNGKQVRIFHPSEALTMGIAMVYQERNLIPSLTGAQNICLGRESVRLGIIDEHRSTEMANILRERVGAKVPLDIPVSELGASQRQMIEILRALSHEPELLILDEPTASLDREDIQCLFDVINRIKKEGKAVVFISHKLDEVFSISDRISVFRDGKKISTNDASKIDKHMCIKQMINREMTDQYPSVRACRRDVLLEAEGVSDGFEIKGVTMNIHRGEVVGGYGLVGAGRTEFAEILCGLRPMKDGKIRFQGESLEENESPSQRIDKGIFLIPEDRRRKGLFSSFSIRENASIVLLKDLIGILDIVKRSEEKRRVNDILNSKKLRVVYNHMEQGIEELSGGNKQKVIIGRWLSMKGLNLLIMDEPTQGIDVGAKREIYNLMRELVEKEGIGILCISSELPELIGICDRIYVFRDGTISAEFERGEFDQEEILACAL